MNQDGRNQNRSEFKTAILIQNKDYFDNAGIKQEVNVTKSHDMKAGWR